MEASNWIALAGILATATVSIATLLLNRQAHREQLEREDLIRERERKNVPHIEFHIDCNVYGPEEGYYLTEFLLDIHNRGDVQHKFTNIVLRVRGIESGKALCYWEGYEPRLSFPKKVLNDVSVIPKGYNYFFVEPGVEQVLTYVTMIPASIRYVLAHAVFEYDEFTPHTAERVFELNPGSIKP
ncbi:MAG: hypothetical protein HPY61_13700 [Methanotrichaceae archaeon]|nr:hypothetical protein [Methanotrichaceae archaeon]